MNVGILLIEVDRNSELYATFDLRTVSTGNELLQKVLVRCDRIIGFCEPSKGSFKPRSFPHQRMTKIQHGAEAHGDGHDVRQKFGAKLQSCDDDTGKCFCTLGSSVLQMMTTKIRRCAHSTFTGHTLSVKPAFLACDRQRVQLNLVAPTLAFYTHLARF